MADDIYDYIVTGAGSAGCVMAARLSESGRHRVLLLEAGPPDTNPWIHIPLGFARTYVNPKINWMFETVPQPQMAGRRLYLPRGKTLGGSSSINGMVYIRGNHGDYDEWRQRGCEGWDWDSVLPYFKKAENQTRGADEFHGTGGPLHVSDQPAKFELAEAALEACVQAGIPRNPDFNGAQQEGCGYYQTTTSNRRRWSTAKAYLNPAKSRPNLTIRTGAHATRVVIASGRATGVEFYTDSGLETAQCRGEVVVSGGAFGSPQLLQLSGLGPAEHLRDMPAVGANLHDHFNTNLNWRINKAITLNDLERSWPRKIAAAAQYGLFRSGPMASNGIHSGAFTRSDNRLERPDLQINIFEWSTLRRGKDGVVPHPFPGFTLMPVHLRPEGRGTVRLLSPDPLAPPAVQFDYLRTEYDTRAILAAIRLCRDIAAQPALKPYIVHEVTPGDEVTSDEDLMQFVRETGVSNQHPTSSCAMGTGTNSVVDPQAACAWDRRAAGGGCLHHAGGSGGQHQRADDHDRREGGGNDAGGRIGGGVIAMSTRIDATWVVLDSIENGEHNRCVDVFRRPDGSHGFEEFRRDVEDAGTWTPMWYYSGGSYPSREAVLSAAAASVVWLAAALARRS